MTETTVDPERLAAIEADLARLKNPPPPVDATMPRPPPLSQASAECLQRQERERQDRLRAAERSEARASLEARRLAPQIAAAEGKLRANAEHAERAHSALAARLAEIAAERRTIAAELAALYARVEQAGRNDLPGEE